MPCTHAHPNRTFHLKKCSEMSVFLMEILREGTQTQCVGIYCNLINFAIFIQGIRWKIYLVTKTSTFISMWNCNAKQISVFEIRFRKTKQKKPAPSSLWCRTHWMSHGGLRTAAQTAVAGALSWAEWHVSLLMSVTTLKASEIT